MTEVLPESVDWKYGVRQRHHERVHYDGRQRDYGAERLWCLFSKIALSWKESAQ